MTAFFSGLLLGFSLILAIGAQNSFILKQGLKKEHVFILCLLCATSDAILIFVGVFGFALISSELPMIEPVARYGGALFLFYYGARSFWTSIKSNDSLIASAYQKTSLTSALIMCLALTWLNPHVYLDTVVLLGTISTQYSSEKLEFAVGAVLASYSFFFILGYGAAILAPILKKPMAWRILEILIGLIMWSIAYNLIRDKFFP